jgi:hypothetical protein
MRTSLLLLLSIPVLVGTAGCGRGKADPAGREIAEWVLEKGGTLTVAGDRSEVKRASALPEGRLQILRINLNQRTVSDEDLQKLSGLRNLVYLGLYGTDVSDRGLEHLAGLRTLEEIELSYTRVGDPGLEMLTPLPRLGRLFLYGTQVTDAGLAHFQDCKNLEALGVYRTPLSDAAHLVSRIAKQNDGQQLEIVTTIDDPKTFTKPWQVRQVLDWRPDYPVLAEHDCEQTAGSADEAREYGYTVP